MTTTKPRTSKRVKNDQMLMSERAKLAKLNIAHLESLGATLTSSFTYEDKTLGNRQWEYEIDTKHGPLTVSIADTCVGMFCRFKDVVKARQHMEYIGANPYSGKYNAYAFGRMTAQQAMDAVFIPHLRMALES